MYSFEKAVAKREAKSILFSYPYKVKPLTENAKFAFALHSQYRGPVGKKEEFIKNNLNLDKFPFTGSFGFYYDDPAETEEIRKEMTKNHAIKCMANSWVPGIGHGEVLKTTGYKALEHGEFEIEVGEKVVHEQPKVLGFDDIKAL